MFGLMDGIARAFIDAAKAEKKLRQDAAEEIKKLREKLKDRDIQIESLGRTVDCMAQHIEKLQDEQRIAVKYGEFAAYCAADVPCLTNQCLAYAQNKPVCKKVGECRKQSASQTFSCPYAAKMEPLYRLAEDMGDRWVYVYKIGVQHHVARFPKDINGLPAARQYVTFLNSLEG